MHRLLLLGVLMCWAFGALAQPPDIDAWMARHFSGKQGVKQDTKADDALYTALGLDSLRRNRFIGEVNGTARLPNGSMPVKFVLWTDTLEAVLHLTRPGDTTTYVADLRTNTIAIHTTGTSEGEVNSSLADLRERVVVNWYRHNDDGSPWRVNRKKPYDRNNGILGQDMQRWTVANSDTIRFMRYERGPSPFLDALEWMPYGGDHPFNLIMQVARAGDPLPRWLKSSAGTIELNIVSMSPRPRPAFRIGKNIVDTRTKTHRALPIRKSDRRANIVELDPGIEIPENERHLWATADPGKPDEPEVTYTGRRSQMRLHTKEPCGEAGTVVVKVWIDRMGQVQQAEVDPLKSTLRSEVCWASAVEAAKRDTYYPMEGGLPWHQGELLFTYTSARSAPGMGSGALRVGTSDMRYNWVLSGRKLVSGPERIGQQGSTGRMILDIHVDRLGVVRSATLARGSTTNEAAALEAVREAAFQLRFSQDPSAPELQPGNVIFVFEKD